MGSMAEMSPLGLPGLDAPQPAGARREADFYPTPSNLWRPLVPVLRARLDAIGDVPVVEAACGDGRLLAGCQSDLGIPVERLIGVDIRPEAVEATRRRGFAAHLADWLTSTAGALVPAGPLAVITNPPFSVAQKFAETSIERAAGGLVVLLLRITFLEPTIERAPFLATHPCDVWIPPSRGRFAGGQTDQATTAWFIWPPAAPGQPGHLVRYLGRHAP